MSDTNLHNGDTNPHMRYQPGALVHARGREWVVLAHEPPAVLQLRPLDGGEEEAAGVSVELRREPVRPATFPDPDPERTGDADGVRTLFDAARLLLRSGAAPIRSLGRISVVPRPYQFVPLLMALRLDPVRLLIADDVGTGKTVEAALVARELLDRGLVRRIGVLAPAHLCDQWQRELAEKFALAAELVAPATMGALERRLPRPDLGVWAFPDCFVSSIDFVKGERQREHFLRAAPDLVIVDEAHICARPAGTDRARPQQQRYELLRDLVDRRPDVHLLLVTATPHSGIDESFRSLLGLLRPDLEQHGLDRRRLRPHIVQRRRDEVAKWLGTATPFPRRVPREVTWKLSPAYRQLFEDVLEFCRGSVGRGEGARQRVRYWAAIALLRCVLSSPAAAATVLDRKAGAEPFADADEDPSSVDARHRPQVTDMLDESGGTDVAPSAALEEARPILTETDRRRLREFAKRARELGRGKGDSKLEAVIAEVRGLVARGFSPIVFCRFIPTAHYVGEALGQALGTQVAVEVVTGELPDERRRELVAELAGRSPRVLVATDCLSEGINLQEHFDAVLHYDLPWNPNRLEQREGRVDRFGQPRPEVETVVVWGEDNDVDLAVLEVLLRKAATIRNTLGISVPVPAGAEEVLEAVVSTVLLRRPGRGRQLALAFEDEAKVSRLHRLWDTAAEQEREIRSFYAQEGIRPEEVQRELEATDEVLGDPGAVERFLRELCARSGGGLEPLPGRPQVFELRPGGLEEVVKQAGEEVPRTVIFDRLADPDAVCLGRSHPLVEAAARHALDRALGRDHDPFFARLGAVRTAAVDRVTALLLLRFRYTFEERDRQTFAEEVRLVACRAENGRPAFPEPVATLGRRLAETFEPVRPGLSPGERDYWIGRTRGLLADNPRWWEPLVRQRREELEEAHRRLRQITREGRFRVRPHTPPDLLGVFVLVPGGARA